MANRENGPQASEQRPHTELDLGAEWQRLTGLYLGLGYHTELGMTAEEYLESLPRFKPQPPEYKGRFDIPLIVEKRIPWERQAELARFRISKDLKSRIDKIRPREGDIVKAPDVTYTGWFSGWSRRLNESIWYPGGLQLTADEFGGGMCEGIAMNIARPNAAIVLGGFDLIGVVVKGFGFPFIEYSPTQKGRGEALLDVYWWNGSHSDYRPLVCGSKIVTG